MLAVVVGVALVAIVAWAVGVLVRRERRRFEAGTDTHRIEAAATRGVRDTRRRARAVHHIGGAAGIGRVDDRDTRR
jgi:hypothetical protein